VPVGSGPSSSTSCRARGRSSEASMV
jgi:hypothetical protein